MSQRTTWFLSCLGSLLVTCAQAAADLRSGVVVEGIKENLEAAKAGLRKGDIILDWARGDASSTIESPFDLDGVEIDESPRGIVTLRGLRGATRQDWSLRPGGWGIEARPQLPQTLERAYLEGRQIALAGNVTQAAERWTSAANQVPGSSPAWLSAWLLVHAAELFANERHWKEADDIYQEALQKAPSTAPAVRVSILRSWATSFERRSDWTNAVKYQQLFVAESRQQAGEGLTVASGLQSLGVTSFRRGDRDEAQAYGQQALDIRRQVAPGSLAVAQSLNLLGTVAAGRGNLTEAAEDYRQGLVITEKLAPESAEAANLFVNLGILSWMRGDMATAEEHYRRALAIRQKLAPDSLSLAACLNQLGLVALERGDLAGAEKYHRASLALKQKLAPESLDTAASLDNLGIVARRRGDLAQAEESFLQALAIERKLAPGELGVASSLTNLGAVAWQRGDLVKAEEYHREALEMRQAKAPESVAVAESLHNLAVIAADRGDLSGAEAYDRHALEIQQKEAPQGLIVVQIFNNLGIVLADRDPAGAEDCLRQALAITQRLAPESLGEADSLQGFGDLARKRGNLVGAEAYYRRALALRERLVPGSSSHAETLMALAGIARLEGQLDASAELSERAMKAFETQTDRLGGAESVRAHFRAERSAFYKDYVDLLLTLNRTEHALEVLERSRARGLLEVLAAAHANIRRGVDGPLADREQALRELLAAKSSRRLELLRSETTEEQVAALTREIDKLLGQLDEVKRQVRASSPAYAALTQPEPSSVRDIQQLLDSDTVLLEYSLGEDRSHLLVVTVTSVASFELPKRAEVESAARRLYELFAARNRKRTGESEVARRRRLAENEAAYPRVSASLSRMVLGPAAAQIRGKRLVIVGDGALQYIPFALLPEPKAPGAVAFGEAEAGAPLLVEHEIVALPSASVLAALRRERAGRPRAPKAVAVLADAVFGAEDSRVLAKTPDRDVNLAADREKGDAAPQERVRSSERLLRSAINLDLGTDGKLRLPRLPFTRREAMAISAANRTGQTMLALDFRASRATAMSPELAQYRTVHFATHGFLDSRLPEMSGLVLSLVDEQGKQASGYLELQDIYNLNLPVELVVLSACETALGQEINGEGLIGLTRGFMYAGAPRVVASHWKVDDAGTAELMGRFYRAMEQDGKPPAAALRQAQIDLWKQKRWRSPYYWAAFQLQGDWK